MGEPDVRILRGAPDDEELAALIAVVSAAAGTVRPTGPVTPARRARRPMPFPSPTSWRTRR